jgi:dienelactone hydrolase
VHQNSLKIRVNFYTRHSIRISSRPPISCRKFSNYKMKTKRHFNRWWLLALVPVLLVVGFSLWAYTPPAPQAQALDAMQSDAGVQVSEHSWLTFWPQGAVADTGLILYPGGRIDPRAYAPAAQAIARQGYAVVIVPMPFNLAVFSPEKAAQVMQAYPDVQHWVVGGHSLGGAMTARYTYKHPDQVDGLLLWAAYPAASDDLSGFELLVSSIYGTQDGLATPEKIDASRPLLPEDTIWVAIEGGNHAQFGWYGPQSGDNPASISQEAQQKQIVESSLNLLDQVENSAR